MDYGAIPQLVSRGLTLGGGPLMVAVEGQEVPEEAAEAYLAMMRRFSLGFAFFPYCMAFPGVNRAFGRPNPIMEVTAEDGSVVDCARQVNPGLMFFDPERMFGVRFDDTVGSAFMEKFVDDLASVGGIPSNGMFLDVHGSSSMVPEYRRSAVQVGRDHDLDVRALNLKVDSRTDAVVERIRQSVAMAAVGGFQ